MVGLPGSGKTTLAHQFAPASRVVSTDAIRAELFGDEAVQGPWAQVEARMIEKLLEAKDAAPALVVYDATNVVRRQRRRAIQMARALGFALVYACWLDAPFALCLQRNQGRSRQVPEAVMHRMQRCLSGAPPDLSDGFDALVRMAYAL
ncbi:MAG: AAA family ATPase [Elainellaceae cyanobacterium]